MVQNGQICYQKRQQQKIYFFRNGPLRSNIVLYCSKRLKMVEKSAKWSKNCPKWSDMVQINFKYFKKLQLCWGEDRDRRGRTDIGRVKFHLPGVK